MPKRINYQRSQDELKQIEAAQRTSPDPRVRQRATGLRLLHLGKKAAAVAALLNVSQATVFNWHAEWRAAGLAGLGINHGVDDLLWRTRPTVPKSKQ